jgi:hypothetical protein
MNTKHSHNCKMAFGKKDPSCPRCQELLAGSAPRAGWQGAHFAKKAQIARYAALPHNCKESGCGVICTHGEW